MTRPHQEQLSLTLAIVAASFLSLSAAEPRVFATGTQEKPPKEVSPQKPPQEPGKDSKKLDKAKLPQAQYSPAEVVAELAIIAHGTRAQLAKARAAIQEEGTIRLATDQGDLTGSYNLRSMRKEKSWQDMLRMDLELAPPAASDPRTTPLSVKYVVGFNSASVWSAQNGQYVTPRPEQEAAFLAQLTHDYTTLLRYKEDGSKLELVGPETVVGVLTNVVDLTLPNAEKTRFWISAKTYRILHAEYELKLAEAQPPTKYRIDYYYTPYKVIQNTVVPARRVMFQDRKQVQEITLNNVVYSAKLDPEIFQHLQEQ